MFAGYCFDCFHRVLSVHVFNVLEQYERAVEDFSHCLKLNIEVIEDKLDRRFAEIHYNIGLAYSFDKKFDESIESFKKAKELLDSRIQMLKDKVSEAAKSSGKEKAPTEMVEWEKEIKELEDLVLLDMNAKVIIVSCTCVNIYSNGFV